MMGIIISMGSSYSSYKDIVWILSSHKPVVLETALERGKDKGHYGTNDLHFEKKKKESTFVDIKNEFGFSKKGKFFGLSAIGMLLGIWSKYEHKHFD